MSQVDRLLDPSEDREFQKAFKSARDQRIPTYFVAFNTDRNLEPNTIGGDEYRNLQVIFPNSGLADGFLKEVRSRMEQIAERGGIAAPRPIDQRRHLWRLRS